MTETSQYSIGVIGSGRMGTDIIDYLADVTIPLTWICISDEEKERAEKAFRKKIERRHRNGLISDELCKFRNDNSTVSSALSDCAGCDIIIEAIHENADAKISLFRELESQVREDTVIVSNSSSINPSRLVGNALRKERFAGLHFFFPVRYTDIVELIRTDHTDETTMRRLRQFLSLAGKSRLEMGDGDAFILNRIFLDCQAQACRFCDEGLFRPRDIDRIVKRGLFPAGIFEFFDSVGIDVACRSVLNYTGCLPDREFYLPLIRALQSLISGDRLGRKNGAGFYDYPEPPPATDSAPAGDEDTAEMLLSALYINSAFKALERGIWSRDELEYALTEYTRNAVGPFARADELGKADISALLTEYHEKTGLEQYRPSSLLSDPKSRSCRNEKAGGTAG